MARPHPTPMRENELPRLADHLARQLPWIGALPGVIGVSLHGGLSRGYADRLSEVDLTVWLTPSAHEQWLGGTGPLGLGIQMIDAVLYDVTLSDLAAERDADWEMTARWDASYAQVLHDPTRQVAALLADKAAGRPAAGEAAQPLFRAWWSIDLAGAIWVHREDPLQGHLTLGQGLADLVRALFLVNGEYVPHDKWLVHLSRSLEWTPDDWPGRLTTALCDVAPTVDGLRGRRRHLLDLWHDVERRAVTVAAPDCPAGLDLTQYEFWRLLSWLVEQAPLPVRTWQERAWPGLLAREPFHRYVTVRDGQVQVDRDRLAAATDADLYPWHLAVVDAVRGRGPGA